MKEKATERAVEEDKGGLPLSGAARAVSLTKLDCDFSLAPDCASQSTSLTIVNPMSQPGMLVAAGSHAERESIGSQVACKLAIENFLEGVLTHCAKRPAGGMEGESEGEAAVAALEAAFKSANSSVYALGHKLAAGGRMSASLVSIVIAEGSVAAGRAGGASAYLLRGAEVFPFFERREAAPEALSHEQLVGAHSLVSVEIASVPIEGGDRIVVFASSPTPSQERRLGVLLRGIETDGGNPAEVISRRVFTGELPPFSLLVRVGPEAIYLRESVAETDTGA